MEFTDLLNGCSPDALVRNAFVVLRFTSNSSSTAFVLTMSASVSPYASVSGQKRRLRLCCPHSVLLHHRPQTIQPSCLRVWAVLAHLATEVPAASQPQTEGHLQCHCSLPSPAMVCASSRTTRRSRWTIPPATRSLPSPPPSSTRRPRDSRVLV